MARATGANAVMAAAFEITYATAETTGYFLMPFVSSNLGEEQQLLASDLLGQGREPLAPELDVANDEGDLVVPVDLRYFGMWLKLYLGEPTTTGSSAPYTHTFASGAVGLPSKTIEIGHPDLATPKYGRNIGVRGNTLKVAMARSGHLNATLGLIARGESLFGAPADATPTTLELRRFPQAIGEVKRDGVALGSVVSAEWMYSNDLDKVETIRADGRIEDADPGTVAFTGTVVLRFKDTVLLDQATSGAPCSLSFRHVIDADNSLVITATTVYLPKPKRPISGPKGIQVTFAFQAAKDPDTGITVTAVLVNDVASY
jgi:hypothetical protein